MLQSPLWQCPVCSFDAKTPTKTCSRCGCHLLLLVKIKTEAQLSILRAEKARGLLLGHPPLQEETPPTIKPLSLKKGLLQRLLKYGLKK